MLFNLFSQLWPLAIALAVIGWFAFKGRHSAPSQPFAEPVQGVPQGSGLSGDSGLHRLTGSTDGVAWMVEVLRLASEVDDGSATRRVQSQNFTRWTAPHCTAIGGSLLLMNLPKNQLSTFQDAGSEDGLLATIKAKAGALALNLYVRQRFGAERAGEGFSAASRRVQLGANAFGQGYAAWCDNDALLGRLTAPAREWLVQRHDSGVAMLWDGEGLTLHWLTPRIKADEIAALAQDGATLVNLLAP